MVLKRILGMGEEKDINIDKYLTDSEADKDDLIYVKSIDLDGEGNAIDMVLKEMEDKNIVILNLGNVLPKKALLGRIIQRLKDTCTDIDGDMGRISNERIMIVPAGIKIVHRA